jgi:hypothetical protein
MMKADYVFSGQFAYLKHHLGDFMSLASLEAQETENMGVWAFDTLKHRFNDLTEVGFKTSRRHIISFRTIRLMEHHLSYFIKVAFLDTQDVENETSYKPLF